MQWNPNIENIVSAYRDHLKKFYEPVYEKKFKKLYNQNDEAAVVEAIVFSWLYSLGFETKIKEDSGTGGADFICQTLDHQEFIVEATSLGTEAVTKKTGFQNDFTQSGSYRLATDMLLNRVVRKAEQLNNYPMPCVLAIASSHMGTGALLSDEAATCLLIGDYGITFYMGEPHIPAFPTTELKNSVFIRPSKTDPNIIESSRRSVSAILLLSIYGDSISALGILHPDPQHVFSPQIMPTVPFLRLKSFPINDGKIIYEWVRDNKITEEYYPISFNFESMKLK